jgi:hypothetical protein
MYIYGREEQTHMEYIRVAIFFRFKKARELQKRRVGQTKGHPIKLMDPLVRLNKDWHHAPVE